MRVLVVSLVVCCVADTLGAQVGPPNPVLGAGGAVATSPGWPSAAAPERASAPGRSVPPGTGAGSINVKPGEDEGNGDVSVDNNSNNSGENARITPPGTSNPDSTSSAVNTDTGFEGVVSGIESGDTVELGSANTATVTCVGGSVVMGGGSTVTIHNNGTAGAKATPIVVTTQGVTVQVPPGSPVVITN